MASQHLRLLSALVILAVAVGGVGSYLTFYRQAGSQTVTINPTATMISKTQVTTVEAKPANYYLSLLESNSSEAYVQLARELRILPELSNATELSMADSRISRAVENLVTVVLKASRSELNDLSKILNEGIPNKRKYCTPLQAWLWVAYDREDYNPLRNYSLDSLLGNAWLLSSVSKNFTSDKWSIYEDARDRVNSPALVNWFINNYVAYDSSKSNVHPQDARLTYKIGRGVCRHGAYIATDFLAYNGYDAKNVSVLWPSDQGHGVSTIKANDQILIVVNFGYTKRNPPVTGTFRTYDEVAIYISRQGPKQILKTFVEDNYQTMSRNNDLIP